MLRGGHCASHVAIPSYISLTAGKEIEKKSVPAQLETKEKNHFLDLASLLVSCNTKLLVSLNDFLVRWQVLL